MVFYTKVSRRSCRSHTTATSVAIYGGINRRHLHPEPNSMKTNQADRNFRFSDFTALGIAVALGLFAQVVPGQAAGFVVTLDQVGPNVVATGSGAFDLTGLTLVQSATQPGPTGIDPQESLIDNGPPAIADVYRVGSLSGPANFGNGSFTSTASSAGDVAQFSGFNSMIDLPAGYQSGNSLSDSATYLNQTFASLGVTPGIYEWTWGGGAEQNFTLDVESVPEPATWFAAVLTGLWCVIGLANPAQLWRSRREVSLIR